jgi:hypothetical protein
MTRLRWRYGAIKTLTLALLALALLAGCGGPAPAPSLTSTSPSVRLAAVQAAQNRYGARKRDTLADEQKALVGQWSHPLTGSAYFRFNADGTFKRGALLGSAEGGYRVLPGGVIELTFPWGLAWKMNYRLSGDTLELKEDLVWLTYTRAAPAPAPAGPDTAAARPAEPGVPLLPLAPSPAPAGDGGAVLPLLPSVLAPAPANDREAIVGRWNHPWGAAAHLDFRSDGTFKLTGLLASPEGRYRVLPGGMIELDYPGTFYGRNVVKVPYRLSGETLELESFGDWVKFTRAR